MKLQFIDLHPSPERLTQTFTNYIL